VERNVFFHCTWQRQQTLTARGAKNFNYAVLGFCTIVMHIMLGTCVPNLTLAILVEFFVISFFHETKIPTVDMKVQVYSKFSKNKI
jgi:hypothetical protein